MRHPFAALLLAAAVVGCGKKAAPEAWAPAPIPIQTPWAAEVSPENVHPEYPRPQMVREKWASLNGLWDYAVVPAEDPKPKQWDGQILVPFCIESSLSGVGMRVTADQALWYSTTFKVPSAWRKHRVMLNFEAVDWSAEVYVNDRLVGHHTGGYTAFSFDVTPYLKGRGKQKLAVKVLDATDNGEQPRGKQVSNPNGIWYTPVTGIWQSVWMEPVRNAAVTSYLAVPDVDAGAVDVTVYADGATENDRVEIWLREGGVGYSTEEPGQASTVAFASVAPGKPVRLTVTDPKLWSPESPFLYEMEIRLKQGKKVVDEVRGYTALRKSSEVVDEAGFKRMGLNNEPYFQYGPLDQGWWPDGLYTAPTDEALKFDLVKTKDFGYNMIRKHIKVEPARWYYYCDQLGMNFPFFIARRYLFSKKSTHAINVISGISIVGVAVATMALVVTLSVFNGFHDLVASFFTDIDPQLKVVPVEGKTVAADDPVLTEIRQLPQIDVATECVEDMALAIYKGRQAMVVIKGVEDNFDQLTHINDILLGDGEFSLHAADMDYGIPGIRLAEILGTGYTYDEPIHIYAPRREGQLDMANPEDAFEEDELYSPGVLFNVKQSKYDQKYILTSIAFARRIFAQQGMLSSLELRLKPGSNFDSVKRDIKKLCGDKFAVKDRFEQQDDTFKIMKIEKLIAYIFLTFILMVACFNIIGSLSMLIIDKKDDVVTLRNLGASDKQIVRVFLFEGRMISAIGAIIGIALGLLLCWVQQQYGLVGLGSSSGSFIINAYPVSVHPEDIILIFFTVLIVGFLSVWYPVRYFAKRLLVS